LNLSLASKLGHENAKKVWIVWRLKNWMQVVGCKLNACHSSDDKESVSIAPLMI
jgi:hypothetical protein